MKRTIWATEARKNKGLETDWILYEIICEFPDLNTYQLAKKLGWTGGRVRKSLQRLQKAGLIYFRIIKENPRIRKLVYPVGWKEILAKTQP